METLRKYVQLANHPERLGVALSCDTTDPSMLRNLVQEEIRAILSPCEWSRIFFSDNKTKIEACNADMEKIEYPWDIVVLVSDDMIPQIKGYDDVIRSHMLAYFPERDGILWFNDGHQGDKLNTLCIFGREMYNHFGYIYHPSYKSLFCDTELTDMCNTSLKSKCVYSSYCIIRHEHPGTGFSDKMDGLYEHNQRFWSQDMYTYISRKQYAYDWSILIPTIPGREESLQRLLRSLHDRINRLAPTLRVQFCIEFDNREMSIGLKRQKLLERALGKYISFIDDDDDITDAYIEDFMATLQGEYHVMRLRGQMREYTFKHSIDMKMTDKMATMDDPPVFIRPPNHLNPMMADVAKLVKFRDATYGEDLDWCIRLCKYGFLQREYQSNESRIHYIYNLARDLHPEVAKQQQSTSYETMLSVVFTPAQQPPQPPTSRGLRLGRNGFVST